MAEPIYRRAVSLLEAEINDELVALEPTMGSCFGFNTVAKDVWHLLEQPRSVSSICSALEAEYDVDPQTCRSEVEELLQKMAADGLLTESSVSAV